MSSTGREMLRAERADFREFIATLTPEQWAVPSLCVGWIVRDVVLHVIGPPRASVLLRHAPGVVISVGRQIDRANADRIDEFAGFSTEQS